MSAVYFDGDSPEGRAVALSVADDQLSIRFSEVETMVWPAADVRVIPDHAGRGDYVLRSTSDAVARIYGSDRAVVASLPRPNRPAPPKGRGRLAAWAVAAVSAVALQIFILVPLLADNLAGFIPAAGERALGEATLGQIRAALDETGMNPLEVCEGEAGVAALDTLVERLSGEQDFRQAVNVSVLDHPMMNAFALPGGYVVLFRGLIEAAEHPDEVAAVLAHEVGHVVSRDPTRHALRSAGSIGVLGLLFGDFAGGAAVLFLAERLISAQYSQAAETAADEFAHEVLEGADIRPGALGDLFETMREKHGDRDGVVAHFMSHPQLGERIEAARSQTRANATYRPAMTEAEWAALQAICAK